MNASLAVVLLLGGGAIGAIIACVFLRTRGAAAVAEAQVPLRMELAKLTERASHIPDLQRERDSLGQERDAARQANSELGEQRATLQAHLEAAKKNLQESQNALAAERTQRASAEQAAKSASDAFLTLKGRFDTEVKGAEEKLAFLKDAGTALSNQFEVLANRILDEKAEKFTNQNKTNLDGLLVPLRDQLNQFKRKIEEVHSESGKERHTLTKQVEQLVALNQTLSEDAKNLTAALKGSVKSQGTWGEFILERVLEAAGLRKGEEYVAQERRQAEDGRWLQPDVVIRLPEEQQLVVDSKVSLVAYERFASADSDAERAVHLKQHLDSVRAQVKSLGEKNYRVLYSLQSLDFVILFVPVEPAFMLAVANDNALFMDAWERHVLLVSPSTLLFVLRTVAHLWRQEAQSRNALEIAKRGGELYDKLVSFVADLHQVGKELKSAQAAYEAAEGKFCEGRGNAIRQAELLRELGVKPAKRLPQSLVDRALPMELAPLPPEPKVHSIGSNDAGMKEVEGGPDLSS